MGVWWKWGTTGKVHKKMKAVLSRQIMIAGEVSNILCGVRGYGVLQEYCKFGHNMVIHGKVHVRSSDSAGCRVERSVLDPSWFRPFHLEI